MIVACCSAVSVTNLFSTHMNKTKGLSHLFSVLISQRFCVQVVNCPVNLDLVEPKTITLLVREGQEE